MPLLAETTPPSKRSRPWLWVLVGLPVMFALLLVGLVAWSCVRPIQLEVGSFLFFAGRTEIQWGPEALSLDSGSVSFSRNFPHEPDDSTLDCYFFCIQWL
jgi:hypothetical protein